MVSGGASQKASAKSQSSQNWYSELRGDFTQLASHAGFGATVVYYGGTALSVAVWLVGAAAVWLLWRPASSAFFKPQGFTQALPRHG